VPDTTDVAIDRYHGRHSYDHQFNGITRDVNRAEQHLHDDVTNAERHLHADSVHTNTHLDQNAFAAAADEDATRARISDTERRVDAQFGEASKQLYNTERNAQGNYESLTAQNSAASLRSDDQFSRVAAQGVAQQQRTDDEFGKASAQGYNAQLRADDQFGRAAAQGYQAELRGDNQFDRINAQVTATELRADDKFDSIADRIVATELRADDKFDDIRGQFTTVSGQFSDLTRNQDNGFTNVSNQFAQAQQNEQREFDNANTQLREAQAAAAANANVAARDAWAISKEQGVLHAQTTRDLVVMERVNEANFRTAERTAYENTIRLADKLGEVGLNVERGRAETREAELRTGERINRDGDRTRELLNRFEDVRLAERGSDFRTQLSVLETTDRTYRDLRDHCGCGGRDHDRDRGHDRRDHRDGNNTNTVYINDRVDAGRYRYDRSDHNRVNNHNRDHDFDRDGDGNI